MAHVRGAETGGLRDMLTHRPSTITTGFTFSKSRGRVFLHVNRKAAEFDGRTDLLDALKKAGSALCTYLTTLCEVAGIAGEYQGKRDWLSIVGDTLDINEFWPPIG